jgi:hypothetical protein
MRIRITGRNLKESFPASKGCSVYSCSFILSLITSGYLFEQAMNSKRPPKLVPDSVLNKDLDLLAR